MIPSNDELVTGIVRRIVDAAQPEKVVLFGSRARGDARTDSDFDVLVIKHSDEPRYRRSIPLYVALADLPVEVEVMVYTPEEIEERRLVPQAFITTAVREGITIYSLLPSVSPLTPYAVELRYDDSFWPSQEVAAEAQASALAVLSFVLDRLPPHIRNAAG